MGSVASTAVGKLYLSLEKCAYDQELRRAEKTQLLQILGTHGRNAYNKSSVNIFFLNNYLRTQITYPFSA